MFKRVATLACLFAAACLLGQGAVTGIEIVQQSPVLAGAPFGRTGPYECIQAKIHFAVDPKLAPNQIIADIGLAPTNAQGLVEFSADLYILRPVIAAHGNGTALLEISNRGGKALPDEFDFATGPLDPASGESLGDGFLLNHGFTLVWVGWEFDVPDHPGLLRAYLPIATDHGKTITGLVRSEWTGDRRQNVIPLGDRDQTGYPVLDPSSPANKLFVRDSVLERRTEIPRSQWQFEDATHVALKGGGFTPGRVYEVVYEAKDPVVAGLGLAAVRDTASYLKYGGQPTPLANLHDTIKRTIAFGVSQSGRFLREFLYDGFNQDEQRRQAFDGVWAHVAGAGRGSFNLRFAQPSRDGHAFVNVLYPVDVPPFGVQTLLAKAQQEHVVPKLFLTNGSYEYWGRCASLIHTTGDAKADVEPPTETRIYFFAGSQHTVGTIPPRPAPTQSLTNTNDYRYSLRALLLAMQAWLVNGTQPPGSRFPRLVDEQLTTIGDLNFPHVHGVSLCEHKREAYRLNFSTEPPTVGPAFPTLVPQVDDDGNELGGIRMPEVAVPLASFTGWNLRSPAIGAPSEPAAFFGSWIPFAKTKAARLAAGDSRLSIEERYAGEQDYLSQIDSAARDLVQERFLLPTDLDLLHQRAAREWAYRERLP